MSADVVEALANGETPDGARKAVELYGESEAAIEIARASRENVEAIGSEVPFVDLGFHQKRKKGKWRDSAPPNFAVPDVSAEGAHSKGPAPVCLPIADTHAHLAMITNPALSLARCAGNGVDFVVAMCDPAERPERTYQNVDTWRNQAAEILCALGREDLTDAVPEVRIAIGTHPHVAKRYTPEMERTLIQYLHDPRTCALGEVGLDYHYNYSEPAIQREIFARQIQIAHESGLPLILHMREGHDDGFAILEEEGWPEGGVLLHCFNLDVTTLKPWVDKGCYVAYGGPLTFKNADEVRQSTHIVPRDRLLTETDAPFMTPEPLRGIECGPEFTVFTARVMADELATSPEEEVELLKQLHANAVGLLDREPTPWQLGR